jgi:hypothetical protein
MTNSTISITTVTCPVRDLKLMTSHELSPFLASKWNFFSVWSIAIPQVSFTHPRNSPTVLTFVCSFQLFFPSFSLHLHQYKCHCSVFMHVYVIRSIFNMRSYTQNFVSGFIACEYSVCEKDIFSRKFID